MLEVPTMSAGRVRVVPRRRGETAPTTIEVPRVPTLPAHLIPSAPSLPSAPIVRETFAEPVFQPVVTPYEQAVREGLKSEQVRRQYEYLANAFGPPVSARRRASIALFSPESSEQTTMAIARLATVLAERNAGKMLLVDGEPAQRRLSRGFQVEGKAGLQEILGGSGASRGEIVSSATERLDLLACGKDERLDERAKHALRTWLSELRDEYRHILCDGGAPSQPLGKVLAQACDASYLIVEIGKTETAAARRAIATLRQLDASVLGCIVIG